MEISTENMMGVRTTLAETSSERKTYAKQRRQRTGRWVVSIAGGAYAFFALISALAP